MKLEFREKYCEDFLCEYFKICDLTNNQDLIDALENLAIENKGFKFMITLDDIGQATYTSMHSIMSNDLDSGDWVYKENIDVTWMDGEDFREDLDFEQKFTLRKLGFKHGLIEVKFEDIFNKILFLDQDSREEIVNANRNLLSIIDEEAYLLKIPVNYSYEAIFAFPNGYFSSDLSPFENYHLAKHLEENYGYHLFGIGASYISFIKGSDFTEEKIDELLKLLMKLYIRDNDEELLEFFKETMLSQKILTLRYLQ